MKISLNWLKEYVQIDCPVEELAEMLSNLGFPNDGIEYIDDDAVIDVEITSNRGDCLSHIGIGREAAAYLGRELRLPDVTFKESDKQAPDMVKVEIANSELCHRYTARVITGVKVGPSPEWIVRRLEAVGLRSINNVVDATNYAMMEGGQPPHAFDFDKLSGGRIVVRNAAAGEKLVSIDGTKCDLTSDMLVIADGKGPVAIAGVMGGLETEVSESTTTILLEDAQFDPVSIRTTGRKLGISSEASFRFARKVDTEMIDWASKRCAQLIAELAGGTVCRGVVDAYPVKEHREKVAMRMGRLKKLLGIDIDKDKVLGIFSGLGFEPVVGGDDAIICTSPTWRHDIGREVDLIEEAARSHGYDKIPVEKKLNIEVAPPDERERLSCRLRGYLGGCGYYETINVTFVDENTAGCFGSGIGEHLSVGDVSRKTANLLRGNLMGSLLEVLRSNHRAGNAVCWIYELADTFIPNAGSPNGLPTERTKLAFACDSEFRDLRGVIEGLVDAVRKDAKTEFRPARRQWAAAAAEVWVDGRQAGEAGVVSKDLASRFDLSEGTVCVAEMDFGMLLEMAGGVSALKPIPRFPAIRRDLSLVVDEKVSWADISASVNTKAPAELEELEFVGIYRGKPIPSGKKSVTASLRFRDEDGTLRHEVVDGFEKAIVDRLTTGLGAELRTV
jgi:phenylalanyl-tRNA synthetase beta chain